MSAAQGAPDTAHADLQRRIDHALQSVQTELEFTGAPESDSARRSVRSAIRAVESALSAFGTESDWLGTTEAHAEQLERLRTRYETRFAALDDIQEAVSRLREVTAPSTILMRGPEELCLASRLDRVILSVIRDRHLVPKAAYFRDDKLGALGVLELLATDSPRLEHPLIETELMRRRRASIVTDVRGHPRVHQRMADVMGWHSYVAAPIVVGAEIVGIIHADAGRNGRSLDVLDGDVLWAFASGLAQSYETAFLRRSLRRQRNEMQKFLEWLGARASALNDASVDLMSERSAPPEPPGDLGVAVGAPNVDDRIVFANVLTRRELDVLRLLARGETNAGIAAQLVIAETTVKFHIRNILRKLRVGNRAEAVARYHRLVRLGVTTDS